MFLCIFLHHGGVSSWSLFCSEALSLFVLPEPKMEAERGSVVTTAFGRVTAIL